MDVSLNRLLYPHRRQKNHLHSSVDLCTNRIIVYEFLLVINTVIVTCTVSEISSATGIGLTTWFAFPSLVRSQIWQVTHRIFERCQYPQVGKRLHYYSVKLLSDYLSVCDHNQPTSQTDIQTTCHGNTELCVASRGKKRARQLTFWHPLLPHGYNYKASCARPG